jgi:tetratricopeptide (TPR) repeat protein
MSTEHTKRTRSFPQLLAQHWMVIILVPILIVTAYYRTLPYAFASDDVPVILGKDFLKVIASPLSYPISLLNSLLYFAIYSIAGLNPAAFRLVNIVLHLANAFLVYAIVLKLSKKSIATLTAVLFTIHPVMVESVTWISGGAYPRYTFFVLLSLLCYMYAEDRKRLYYLSVIFFFIGCFISPAAVVLPFLVLLYELAYGNIKKDKKKFFPFIGIPLMVAVPYSLMLKSRIIGLITQYYHQGRIDNPLTYIPDAVASYLELLFWPEKLTLYHSEVNFTLLQTAFHITVFLICLATAIVCYKKNKFIFFWYFFFLFSLVPVLMPIRITWLFAERYVYLGSIGILAITSWAIIKANTMKGINYIIYPLVLCIVLMLTARTFARNLDWRNEDELWIATAQYSPSDFKTHNNLGTVLQKYHKIDEAKKQYLIAIQINPRYAEAHYNMALLYHNYYHDAPKALEYYKKSVEFKPLFWQGYHGIASIYIFQRKYDEAEKYIQKSISINPDFAGSYHNLGIIYVARNQPDKAMQYYKRALELDPTFFYSHYSLGRLYYNKGDYNNAKLHLETAAKQQPQQQQNPDIYVYLARTYKVMNNNTKAKEMAQRALEISPDNAEAQTLLKSL